MAGTTFHQAVVPGLRGAVFRSSADRSREGCARGAQVAARVGSAKVYDARRLRADETQRAAPDAGLANGVQCWTPLVFSENAGTTRDSCVPAPFAHLSRQDGSPRSSVFSDVDRDLNTRTLAVGLTGTDATDIAFVHEDIELDGDGGRSTMAGIAACDSNTASVPTANVSGAIGSFALLCAKSGVARSNNAIATAVLHATWVALEFESLSDIQEGSPRFHAQSSHLWSRPANARLLR